MVRVTGLDEWILPVDSSPETVNVEAVIHFSIDIDSLRLIDKPKQRLKQARCERKAALTAFIKQFTIENFDIIGLHYGLKFKATLALVEQMKDGPGIAHITILQVYSAQKKELVPIANYFCLKILFIVQFEGLIKGLQLVDEQFGLLKAASFEDAQHKLKPYIDTHEKPYMNSDGKWVRWKFDRILDYNDISLSTDRDFQTEGIEVFSEFMRRRRKPEDFWNGKW